MKVRLAEDYRAALRSGDKLKVSVIRLLTALIKNREHIIYEMADLWFHSLVVLAQSGIRPEEIAQELGRRFGKRKAEYA